jgi:DHA1 family bicyclomycin/chloramphenicol resistance-like MFS transporter
MEHRSDGPAAPRFLDRTTPPNILTLVLLSGLGALAMNIHLPSLPRMAEWFDTSYQMMQLSVSLFFGMNAVMQLLLGPLSDRFGRRPVILGCCVVFLVATAGTLVAPNIETFLACRMFQAVIAGGLVLSRAIVRDMVEDARAASMIGYVTMGMALVPMVAPIFGGFLDEWFGWQSNFVLMFVLGLGIFLLARADIGETIRRRQPSLAAQFREYPALLRSQRFWGYSVFAAAMAGSFFSYVGGSPYVGSVVYGLGPAELGLYLGAPAVGYALGNYLSGRHAARVGLVRMTAAGALVLVGGLTGLLVVTLAGVSGPNVFFGFITLVGLGNGLGLPSATAGMMSVRPHLAGTASGLGGAIMLGGGAAMSVIAGIALEGGDSELPLVLLMLASALVCLASTVWVARRNRQLGL